MREKLEIRRKLLCLVLCAALICTTLCACSNTQDVFEQGRESGYSEGHDAGYEEGRSAGYEEGYQLGLKEGKSSGYNTGQQDGWLAGYEYALKTSKETAQTSTTTQNKNTSTTQQKSVQTQQPQQEPAVQEAATDQPTYYVDPSDGYTVYVTDTGSKYHRSSCSYLKNSSHAVSLSDALACGYTACSRCKP